MEGLNIPKLANELSNDPVAVKHWRKFYDLLGLSSGEVVVLTKQHSIGLMTSYELFSHILNTWQSENGKEATNEQLKIIRKSLNEVVTDDSLQQTIKSLKFPLKHNYPGMVAKYVPRPYLEKQIVDVLTNSENLGLIHFPIVVLHGIGGVGKTTLARKICQLVTQKSFFSIPLLDGNCVWINAEREELIIKDFAELLGSEVKTNESIQAILKKIYASQFDSNHILIVFDNLDNYNIVLGYLPLNLETKVSVLITSNAEFPLKDFGQVKNISVDKFTIEQMSELVKKIIPNISQAEIQTVDEYTGRIPYLVNLVCVGLAKWKLTFPDKDFSEYFDLEGNETNFSQKLTDYQNYSEKIVDRQMNLIEKYHGGDCTANKMLRMLAYCNSNFKISDFIKLTMKHFDFESGDHENSINSGINILIRQGFLEKEADSIFSILRDTIPIFKNPIETVSIHRSYQAAIRRLQERDGKEQFQLEELFKLDGSILPLDCSLLWESGEKYGNSMINKMINCSYMLPTIKDKMSLRDLVEFARTTKSRQGFAHFILFGDKQMEIETLVSHEHRHCAGIFVEDFGALLQQLKDIRAYRIQINVVYGVREEIVPIQEPGHDRQKFVELVKFVAFEKQEWLEQVSEAIMDGFFVSRGLPTGYERIFHDAAKEGELIAVKYLIDKGVNLNVRDLQGRTPLHEAAIGGNLEITKLLLSRLADPNISCKTRSTPLQLAVENNHIGVVEALLESGADPNVITYHGWSLLFVAARDGKIEIARALLKAGSKPNTREGLSYWSPLFAGVASNHLEIVRLLLLNGASLKIKNKDGKTVLEFAKQREMVDEEIVRLLSDFTEQNLKFDFNIV